MNASRWRVFGASVAGASHLQRGAGSDDAFAFGQSDAFFVIAVADGAGTKPCAAAGARILVDAAKEAAMARGSAILDESLRPVAAAALAALEAHAAAESRPVGDYAATFLCVVCDGRRARALQIGDGAIVARLARSAESADPAAFRFTLPAHGEYQNETTFLTASEAIESAAEAHWDEPLDAIAMFSDGLERLAIDFARREPHAKFFEPLWRFAAAGGLSAKESELAAFLASERVRKKTDDDVTLVLAVREPAEAESGR